MSEKPNVQPNISTECYISVDVETAGPYPIRYSMLSIGACLVQNPDVGFYIELQPVTMDAVPGALAISNLTMAELTENGTPPREAMRQFAEWVERTMPPRHRPIFVALNAPFDWMFVNEYFHHFLRFNPFGHSALDIKAFYMGLTGVSWTRTSMQYLSARYLEGRKLTHNALQDARDQAEIFAAVLAEAQVRRAREEACNLDDTTMKGATL